MHHLDTHLPIFHLVHNESLNSKKYSPNRLFTIGLGAFMSFKKSEIKRIRLYI
jgi:hypothetical protein